MQRIIKTTKAEIRDYWMDNLPMSIEHFNFEPHTAQKQCWNCGVKRSNIQRCHIVPDTLGGKDTPSNYVLLCGQCHNEAPDVINPKYMWLWIYGNTRYSSDNYNLSIATERLEENENITLTDIVAKFDSYDQFGDELFSVISDQGGRIKVSTYYYGLLELAERKGL